MSEQNQFEKLASIDVSKKLEKKNNLPYLSWTWAVDQLLRHDPAANWTYAPPMVFPDGTQMVVCDVTAFGKTMRSYLPVMDYRNKPIANPDAFATNTAMQRCLVKAIALHGLGLYVYAGEDLPEGAEQPRSEEPKIDAELLAAVKKTAEKGSDAFRNAWAAYSQETRSKLRQHISELQKIAQEADAANEHNHLAPRHDDRS